MAVTMQQRRDTSANWTSANPVMAAGEIGYETDTGRTKIGDGATAWNSLNAVVVTSIGPSGDATGTTDRTNLNNYINLISPGGKARVLAGNWYVDQPIPVPSGCTVEGPLPGQQSGGGSSSKWGACFQPGSAYSATGFNATSIFLIQETSGPTENDRAHIRNLMIYGTGGPASVDGIAIYGKVAAVGIEGVIVYGATGNGFVTYPDGSANYLDGWYLRDCLAQNCTGIGFSGSSQDMTAVNCHAQSCTGDGWQMWGPNCRFIGCRSDLSNNGFTLNLTRTASSQGNSTTFTDNYTFIGCGTQGNNANGLNLVDTYTGAGTPGVGQVVLVGGSFDMDGHNAGAGGGGYGGISVNGLWNVTASGTRVMTNNISGSYSPAYAITTSASGTGSRVPISISFSGGSFLSGVTGIVNDLAPAAQLSIDLSCTTFTGNNANLMTAVGSPAQWSGPSENFGGVFGDGSMGAVAFNGTNTYTGTTLAGSTYTLTRDLYATSCTISNTVTVNCGAYRIHCRGTFSNAGTVSMAGNAGAAGGAAGGTNGPGSNGGGRTGGAGATGNGSAGGGGGGVPSGNAGAGGAGGTGTAGAAGTSSALIPQWWKIPSTILNGIIGSNNSQAILEGGAGGGGGGGDGTNSGGGGGGGGGLIVIFAWNAVNTGTITAAGGAGGSPAAGNAGGGGGGAGGAILVYTLAPWTAGTTSVAGGGAGTAHGTGSNGSAGTAGTVANILVA